MPVDLIGRSRSTPERSTHQRSWLPFSRRNAWKTEVLSRIHWFKADIIDRLRSEILAPGRKAP
jgi:hypothetical protein